MTGTPCIFVFLSFLLCLGSSASHSECAHGVEELDLVSGGRPQTGLPLLLWALVSHMQRTVTMQSLEDFNLWPLISFRIDQDGNNHHLPNWLMSLTKLKQLDVSHCGSIEVLPPFGRLPYLEKLTIGVQTRKLGVGFLGIETVDHGSEGISKKGENGEVAPVTAFPKLKELCIWKMEELEEWDGIGMSSGEKDTKTEVMPQLRELEIKGCNKLKALPDYVLTAPLVELKMNECPALKEHYEKDKGEDWHKISHISEIEINYQRSKRPPRNY